MKPYCGRCSKAGLECAGFDLKLGWCDVQTVNNNSLITLVGSGREENFQRRNVGLVKFPKEMQYDTYFVLNKKIEGIERIDNGMIGPFGVYTSVNGVERASTRSTPLPNKSILNVTSTVLTNGPGNELVKTPLSSSDYLGSARRRPDIQKLPRVSKVSNLPNPSIGISKQSKGITKRSNDSSSNEINRLPAITNPNHGIPSPNAVHLSVSGNRRLSEPRSLDGEFPIQSKISNMRGSPQIKRANVPMRESKVESEVPPVLRTNLKLSPTVSKSSVIAQIVLTIGSSNHSSIQLQTWINKSLLDYAKLSIFAIKGITYNLSEQNMLHILYPKFFPNTDISDWQADPKILDRLVTYRDGKILTPLFMKLMSGFTGAVFSMNKFHFEGDYFDTLLVPFVKEIVFNWVCQDSRMSPRVLTDPDSIKLAIKYLALGISAFKSSNINLAIELRKLSIDIVNFHLDDYDNENPLDTYETLLLLALILQIELDNCFSVYENFDLIFAIGDHILKNKLKLKLFDLDKFLVGIFRITYTLYESTQAINFFNYSISDADERDNYGDLNDDYIKEEDEDDEDDENDNDLNATENIQVKPSYKNLVISNDSEDKKVSFTITFKEKNKRDVALKEALETPKYPLRLEKFTSYTQNNLHLMVGLPKSLLDIFHEVIHLTNHKNVFQQRKVFPRNFPRICAEIEDKLINWTVEDVCELDLTRKMHQLLLLNVRSFQSGMIVYYNRLIKGKRDHLNLAKALDSIEKLVLLGGIPSFWVLLVSGSEFREKSQQQKVEELWDECGFDYWRGKQILYEIWRRSEEDEEFGFMDIVREWDIVLCLE